MTSVNRPLVGVALMLVRDGRILLGKRLSGHGSGSYGWVGGHLEYGETLHDGVLRELAEETGIVLAPDRLSLLAVNNVIAYDRHYIDIVFHADLSIHDGDPVNMEPAKVESWSWHAMESLPSPLFRAVELGVSAHRSRAVYDIERI